MISGTIVTYPDGDTISTGTVARVDDLGDGRRAVLVDRTAFHPVDTAWPDQPADQGVLRRADGTAVEIRDAVVAATDGGSILYGADVPVRTGTEGWTFAVAHVVTEPVEVGETVEIEADAEHRRALSVGHTACHLASLALDRALEGAWRKEVPVDALGAPAFDALAIQESRILPGGSRDVYRIGKSLRRKGFDPAALDDLDDLAARVNALLAAWIDHGGAVRIERDGQALADRRTWVCEIDGGTARIPCGGTHAHALADLGRATVSFDRIEAEGGVEIVMTTIAG